MQVSVITVKRAYLELERDGVIITRQGKGSFIAESADLQTQLRRGELDAHLSAAVTIGLQLGLTSRDLETRVRELVDEQSDRNESTP